MAQRQLKSYLGHLNRDFKLMLCAQININIILQCARFRASTKYQEQQKLSHSIFSGNPNRGNAIFIKFGDPMTLYRAT